MSGAPVQTEQVPDAVAPPPRNPRVGAAAQQVERFRGSAGIPNWYLNLAFV